MARMTHEHRPRTGDEPSHARSPLRMRLALACVGLANGLIGIGIFGFWLRTLPFLVFFAALALLALGNIVVVLVRIRQGAHYQPGRDVPPYRPVDPMPRGSAGPRRISPRRRYVRYFLIMGTCVLLVVLAWFWVRYYSVLAAGVMSVIAALLPPIAAVVTNADSPILRDDESAPSDEYFEDGPPREWFDEDPPRGDGNGRGADGGGRGGGNGGGRGGGPGGGVT
jgi:uncharacterized membrane protein YgcG